MFGAVLKSYYAEKRIDLLKYLLYQLCHVLQKFEAQRPELSSTDILMWMWFNYKRACKNIREAGIDFEELPERQFDDPMGEARCRSYIWCYRWC